MLSETSSAQLRAEPPAYVRRSTVVWLLGGYLALSACAPTARTAGPYKAKAVKTAEAVASAVNSDLILIEAAKQKHTTAAYVSVATSQAEDSGSQAAATFRSIQPPDRRSDVLRSQLGDLLDEAEKSLGDTRIVGRRGDRDALVSSKNDLEQVATKLRDFADQHK
jgi:hypothetical protein